MKNFFILIGIGVIWLIVWLPRPMQYALGRVFGKLLYRLSARRRRITEVNIKLCFPELTAEQQHQLVKKTFAENAIGFIEIAVSWFRDPAASRKLMTVEGLENLDAAKKLGRGVLLVGAHYSMLDFGALLLTAVTDMDAMYRPHQNPTIDRLIKRSREKFCENVVDRKNMRQVVKCFKQGHVFWYAPDQDYGKEVSVFAPFFGISAATVKYTSKLATITNSPVIILGTHRKEDNSGYIISFSKPLEGYPSGDDVKDATQVNLALEQQIRKYPAQYMWVHRRFKTRPEGEESFYKDI